MSKAVALDTIIALPAVMTAETFTNDEEFEKLYSKVKDAVSGHVPDTSTKTGREAIKSLAYRVTRTKTALISHGKKLTEDWRDQTKKVNAACNTIEERLDALRDEVKAPVDEWEAKEKDRVKAHVDRLDALIAMSKVGLGLTTAEYQEMLEAAQAVQLGASWEEYAQQASVAREDAIDTLNRMIGIAKKLEQDAAELDRLRAEAAQRETEDAERLATEKAAQDEADRLERERKAEEDRKAENDRVAEQARQQAIDEAAERVAAAERQAALAEERANQEIADAAQKVEDERKRVEAEQAAADAEQLRRDRDKKHRKTVNDAIIKELVDCSGITSDQAETIVMAMVSGLVPNVTLKY